LATQKRTIKKSGEWFREVIQQNGFVDWSFVKNNSMKRPILQKVGRFSGF
jgi:hypothetical protein